MRIGRRRNSKSDLVKSGEPSPPLGITKLNDSVWELHKPTDGIPAVEIIFFHGLQLGHDYENAFWKTWTVRNNGDLVWPKDWLGEAFPQARILSISYESSVRANSEQRDSLGEILINDIINDDQNIGQFCPVILVGHSLGGIVIKQFLLSTCKEIYRNNFKHFKVKRFRENFKGVFYYANPHGGAKLKKIIPRKGPYVKIFGILSMRMASISEEFRVASGQFFEATAYTVAEGLLTTEYGSNSKVVEEDSKVPEEKKKRKRVVDEASKVPEGKNKRKRFEYKASSPCEIVEGSNLKVVETSKFPEEKKIVVESSRYDTDFYITVDADHFDVCKPHNRASEIFQQLVELIRKVITGI